MQPLIGSSILLLTIVLALALGVGLGYACIIGVLRAMGHRPEKQEAAQLTTATVSGD